MITVAEKSPRRWRFLFLLFALLAVIVVVAAYSAPGLLEAGAGRWAASQGLSLQVDGLFLGRALGATRVSVRLPDQSAPFFEARGIRVEPLWADMVRGRWRVGLVAADSLVVRWDEHVAAWVRSRPASSGQSPWRLEKLTVSDWTVSAFGQTAVGTAEIEGLAPAAVEAVSVTATLGTGVVGTLATESGHVILRANGTELPAMLRTVPGIEAAKSGWILDAGARLAPRPALGYVPAPQGSPQPPPAWFETLLRHEIWAKAAIRAESGVPGYVAVRAFPESGSITLAAAVGSTLVVEASSAFTGDTLRTVLSYRARPRGEAALTGSLNLIVLPRESFRVLPGSSWTLSRSSVSGNALPEGTIGFSGDQARGYHLLSEGALGSWSLHLDPQKSMASWNGVMNWRQAGPVRKFQLAGAATVQVTAGSLDWSAKGTVSGQADAGATPVRLEARGEAGGTNARMQVTLPFLRIEDARNPEAMALTLTNVKVTGSSADWRTEPGLAGRVVLHGRSFPIELLARGGAEHAELVSLNIGGIAIRARAAYPGGRYRETVVTIEETPLAALVPFLPPAQRVLAARSTIAGSFLAAFTHTADRRLDGSLRLRVAKFHDPVSRFVVEGLDAEIPIRQRFVDPGQVQFVTQAERWPEVPVNVRIAVLGRETIEVRDVTGRAVFADYVFRFRDMTCGILGGTARSRFILDPFRNREGRWRAALELKVEGVPLRNLYEAFVGKGPASRGLEGAIGLELETAWSDTECLEGRGFVQAAGPGKVGRRVLAALVQMMEKEKRPPAVTLMLIGDYKFDAFRIDLARDASIGDFRTNLLLTAQDEPFLGEVKLEMPLLKLLQGLPVEVEHDIGLRRGR